MDDTSTIIDSLEPGRWTFLEFVPKLSEAIANCSAKASRRFLAYRAAVKLCAAGRDLITWYFKEWQSDPDVAPYAAELASLFEQAVEALNEVRNGGAVSDLEREHLGKMIVNTGLRVKVCTVLASDQSPEVQYERAMALYGDVPNDRGFDLSVF